MTGPDLKVVPCHLPFNEGYHMGVINILGPLYLFENIESLPD